MHRSDPNTMSPTNQIQWRVSSSTKYKCRNSGNGTKRRMTKTITTTTQIWNHRRKNKELEWRNRFETISRKTTGGFNQLYSRETSSRKHAYIMLTPLNPLLYNKTWVYRAVYYCSFFCSKHRLLVLVRSKHRLRVLVRTASPRRF